MWRAAPPGDITIDVDATLLNVHSDKGDAASTYKRGYGFHPIGAWCDTTDEPLQAMLRPGNTGSNDTGDHLELLDRALAVLPGDYRAGHEPGDDPRAVRHHIVLRADSAGATHGFVAALVESDIEYSIGHPINASVREALLSFQEEDWCPAVETDGTIRDGVFVAELTGLMDLSSWGIDARLIVRRERPHPGAQLSMFDMSEGWRHTAFITNASALGVDPAVLELRHRGHARAEDRARNWKDCGLANLPFASFTQNLAWVAVSLIAGALLAWAQMTCLDGALRKEGGCNFLQSYRLDRALSLQELTPGRPRRRSVGKKAPLSCVTATEIGCGFGFGLAPAAASAPAGARPRRRAPRSG